MIDGCLAWQRDGLETPNAVLSATQEYRADSDLLEQFLDARCVRQLNGILPSGRAIRLLPGMD